MNDLREHLLWLLRGGHAHIALEEAVADLPESLRGQIPAGIPHSPWRLLEHMRIAQWDILEFSRNPDHVSPEFPRGYWPEQDAPPDAGAWDATIDAFQHWVYTNPNHSRQERDATWLDIRRRFGGVESWSGYEAAERKRWHRQLHPFTVPFYSIEYGIARLASLAIWSRSR